MEIKSIFTNMNYYDEINEENLIILEQNIEEAIVFLTN